MITKSMKRQIRELRADEWESYRALRLRSLKEDPDSFASTLSEARTFAEDRWRDRVTEVIESPADLALVAEVDSIAAGLLWVHFDDTRTETAELYQMWVAPEFRRIGLGEALLHRARDWAQRIGAREAALAVTYRDSPALRLYAL